MDQKIIVTLIRHRERVNTIDAERAMQSQQSLYLSAGEAAHGDNHLGR